MPRITRRIQFVGVELEGLWNRRPTGEGQWHSDGSVCFSDARNGGSECDCREEDCEVCYPIDDDGSGWAGEYVSNPMPPIQVPGWIKQYYPDRTNLTCGLHVHISVRSALWYSMAMDGANSNDTRFYVPFILSELARWGHKVPIREGSAFWNRLKGYNSFCIRDSIDPDEQARTREKYGCRYRVVNFCYALHRTIEVRVLPAFQGGKHLSGKALAVSAVRTLIRSTEKWLASLPADKDARPIERTMPEAEDMPRIYKPLPFVDVSEAPIERIHKLPITEETA